MFSAAAANCVCDIHFLYDLQAGHKELYRDEAGQTKVGVETYIAAAVHQINCFVLGVYLMYRVYNLQDYSLYSKWLALSFLTAKEMQSLKISTLWMGYSFWDKVLRC